MGVRLALALAVTASVAGCTGLALALGVIDLGAIDLGAIDLGAIALGADAHDRCCAGADAVDEARASAAPQRHPTDATPCDCPEGCDDPCGCCVGQARSIAMPALPSVLSPARWIEREPRHAMRRDTAFDAGLVRELFHVPRPIAHV